MTREPEGAREDAPRAGRRVVVIGAGISGLVFAYERVEAGDDVIVLEAGDRPGGAISTTHVDGFLVERGPNSIRMTDEIESLAERLGIDDELVYGDARAPRYLFHKDRLVAAPAGIGKFVRTPLLSAGAKLRLLREPFVSRPADAREESIREFTTRRFGREVHDVFVAAFVSGIYAGDTAKLSAEAVFPKLVELERDHGGVARGALAALRGKRKPTANGHAGAAGDAAPEAPAERARPKRRALTLASFAAGLARLPEALADALGERLRLSTPAVRVERAGGEAASARFVVVTERGERIPCDDLVVATPAREAGVLLASLAPRAAELLGAIEYPPLASVAVAFPRERVRHAAHGFGFLAPRVSKMRTLGGIFTSSLFEDRAPDGWVSFTCFVGGATDPGAVELSDADLVGVVAGDLGRAVGAAGDPRVLAVTRWRRAIPQYTIGHRARAAEIRREAGRAHVLLLGNYLDGVAVGDCVKAAGDAARALVSPARGLSTDDGTDGGPAAPDAVRRDTAQ